MKRWDEIVKEEPTKDLTAKTEARVFKEMSQQNMGRRLWLQFAGITAAAVALIGGYSLMQKNAGEDGEIHPELFELAADENLDLESMEDLDVIEILEELEEWQSG